jgi:hypoxanthine phosphoribosyltransferase
MDFDEIVVSAEQLHDTVLGLSGKINLVYDGVDKLVVVVLLEGARPFARDLVKLLDLPVEIVFIKASSYNGGTSSSGKVAIEEEADLGRRLAGQDVLIVDDIYDTGLTLDSVTKSLAGHDPKSMKICVLLEKMIKHTVDVPIDFIGLKIDDLFVIGYGLDYNEKYRELPFIAKFSESQV